MATGIEKYHDLIELGRGGSGIVSLGLSRGPAGFNKLVVLKAVRDEFREERDLIQMFFEEARLAARMNHPNVVQTNEVLERAGLPVIVMEYLEGQTLQKILTHASNGEIKPPSVQMHLTILVNVLSGLHYAHTLKDFDGTPLNLVHRDVTPHNVFVTYDGHVKLLDFGIAKLTSSRVQTAAGVIKGKLGYMSPEQIDSGDADCRADVFAVGIMIWEAVSRRRIWEGLGEAAIMRRLINGEIPRLIDAAPDAPPGLVAICDRALAPEKEDRYASAFDLQQDLRLFFKDEGYHVSPEEIGAYLRETFSSLRLETDAMIGTALRKLAQDSPMDWDEVSGRIEKLRSNSPEGYTATGVLPEPVPAWRKFLYAGLGAAVAFALGVWWWPKANGERQPSDTATAQGDPTSLSPANAAGAVAISAPLVNGNETGGAGGASSTETAAIPSAPAAEATPARVPVKPIESKRFTQTRPTPPPIPAAVKKPAPNCDPPWYIDAEGIKQFRVECLKR